MFKKHSKPTSNTAFGTTWKEEKKLKNHINREMEAHFEIINSNSGSNFFFFFFNDKCPLHTFEHVTKTLTSKKVSRK